MHSQSVQSSFSVATILAIVVFLVSFCVVLGPFSRDAIGLWALQDNIKN